MNIIQMIIWLSVGIASITCCVIGIRISRDEKMQMERLSKYYKSIMNNAIRKEQNRKMEECFFMGYSENEAVSVDSDLYFWYSHSRHPSFALDSVNRPEETEAVDDWIRSRLR